MKHQLEGKSSNLISCKVFFQETKKKMQRSSGILKSEANCLLIIIDALLVL